MTAQPLPCEIFFRAIVQGERENRDGGCSVKIGTPKEIIAGENRVAMTPASAKDLQKLGYDCMIETGAGVAAGFPDDAYAEAGVEVVKTAAALYKAADIVAKVRPPED